MPIIQTNDYLVYPIRRSGKIRYIEEPNNELKTIQQQLISKFSIYPLRNCCTAVINKGAVHNALIHKKAQWILKLDIKNCYQSIHRSHLEQALVNYPELLSILDICLYTTPRSQRLPTGAPTSPILCNIALTPIDIELEKLATEYKLTYTRYLDDMIFSTKHNKYPDKEIFYRANTIIRDHDLFLNRSKSKWLRKCRDPMLVTGVSVNEHVGVSRTYKQQLRSELFYAAKNNLELDTSIQGKLGYVKHVDRYLYNKLISFYNKRRQCYAERRCSSP